MLRAALVSLALLPVPAVAGEGLCGASQAYCMGYIDAVVELAPLRQHGVCLTGQHDRFAVIEAMEPLVPGTDNLAAVLDALRLLYPCK